MQEKICWTFHFFIIQKLGAASCLKQSLTAKDMS